MILEEFGSEQYRTINDLHHIKTRPKSLCKLVEFLKDDLDYIYLVDMVAERLESKDSKYDFQMIYVLFNLNSLQRVMIELNWFDGETIPSLISYYQNASWMEREQAKKIQINFLQKNERSSFLSPNLKDEKNLPTVMLNPNRSEEPFPEESWRWKEVSLFSNLTKGNFSLQICLDPDHLVDLRCFMGFHSRGIEKSFEKKEAIQIGRLIDPIIWDFSPYFTQCWYKMIEDICGIQIPEKAQALRIVLLELARVIDHLSVISEILISLEIDEFRFFLDAREKLLDLMENYSNHRWGIDSLRLGGVRFDLPHGWIAEYQETSKLVLKNIKLVHNALMTMNKFRAVLDVAGIDSQTVLNLGVTGPSMRAAGLNFDFRKSMPFYFYKEIDFDVPVGVKGTAFDRYLVRYEEIKQSFRILTQVLDNLPLGDYKIADDLTHHKLNLRSLNLEGAFWSYSGAESPNGEVGIITKFDQKLLCRRFKIKSSSIVLAQSLKEFLFGLKEHQLSSHIASLGLRKSEMDR